MRILPILLAVFLAVVGMTVIVVPESSAGDVKLPDGTLTSAEVFALFNDRTVTVITAVRQREGVSYYDPNGEIRQMRNGVMRVGHWRVTDSGRICLQMEDLPEKCRIIVKEGAVYKKYIVRKNGLHQHSVTYIRFREGNPEGL